MKTVGLNRVDCPNVLSLQLTYSLILQCFKLPYLSKTYASPKHVGHIKKMIVVKLTLLANIHYILPMTIQLGMN